MPRWHKTPEALPEPEPSVRTFNEKAYVAERKRAHMEAVARSADRAQGYFVPHDYDALPPRAENQYDPRKW